MNFRIRVPEIRLIGPDGSQMGIFQTRDAVKRAEEFGLDLVEISPMAKPPVCKIMDYGKYKYDIAKREHEAKKHQSVVHLKEVKLRPSTDEHDVQTKLRHIKRFLEDGDKAKVTIQFRGREMAHKELGNKLMEKIKTDIGAAAEIEQPPKFEGRFLTMIIGPSKGAKHA